MLLLIRVTGLATLHLSGSVASPPHPVVSFAFKKSAQAVHPSGSDQRRREEDGDVGQAGVSC